MAVATVMKVHPSWSHEDLLAAVDRRNNADPAEERTKATAVEKTKGATRSMLEKAKPVAVATKANEVTISEQTCVSSAERKRWKGRWPLETALCSSAFLRRVCGS